MKLNTKDIYSGVLLILVAAIGLWLNQDHALGSARRMGPGYMPMLVFWVQLVLGGAVLGIGLFNGPDPLERWTKLDIAAVPLSIAVGTIAYLIADRFPLLQTGLYSIGIGALVGFLVLSISEGWRPVGFVLAGMCVFSLLLEKGGLIASIVGTVVIACFGERTHRPLGVAGLTLFLCVLCWAIFIYYLDIRVSVWPQFT